MPPARAAAASKASTAARGRAAGSRARLQGWRATRVIPPRPIVERGGGAAGKTDIAAQQTNPWENPESPCRSLAARGC
ncbi:hypothetical protein Tchl_0665 [Thauera chlorobenzoica]|uniref:Uncharacterized protein n=1 Tax=Thauera chlorobenzoica TaxID=96773 RepID=A0A1L6F9D9_9RHOO|nr:hypothetical protein Tchl_0665 [Thauera chlorobenzoica]